MNLPSSINIVKLYLVLIELKWIRLEPFDAEKTRIESKEKIQMQVEKMI